MTSQGAVIRMPRRVKSALAVVWLQAVMNALVAWVFIDAADTYTEHGVGDRYDAGLLRSLGYFSILFALLLGGCAVLAAVRRSGGLRHVLTGVEALVVLGALVGLFSGGGMPCVAAIVLSAVVAKQFASAEGRAWFSQ